MPKIPKLLSKTKLMKGYQCLKSIHLHLNRPELEAPVTAETQARFDQGNEVGEAARKAFPGGVLVDSPPWEFVASLKRTRDLIEAGTETIYEAAFEYSQCYARVDVIQLSKLTGKWSIIEVKSSTKVKPEQLDDVGLQAWIVAKSGLPIGSISVMHLNPRCRFPDLSDLFVTVDVTQEIRDRYLAIQPRVRGIFDVIAKDEAPALDIGPHCMTPRECGFVGACWEEKKIPKLGVFQLPKIGERKWELYRAGVLELTDERLSDLTPLQARVVAVHRSGERFVDSEGVRAGVAEWRFPLVFLDFETINPAIPRYPGTGPFQQVPFQFSVHVWGSPEAEDLEHHEFLHMDPTDPRPELIPALLGACAGGGSIVSYYAKFESERIQEMAECFPEFRAELEALLPRMVDPLPLIRECVYDRAFEGSFSLKAVAPALLGAECSYEGMAVPDGSAAQRAFEELIAEATEMERKEELHGQMLEYCAKDTLMMVALVRWLREVSA